MGGMLWGLQSSPVRSGHRYVNQGLIVGHSTSAIFFVELCHVLSCGCLVSLAQSVARLIQEPEVPESISGPATYFRFSFRLFKKDSSQLLAKVCAQNTEEKCS